MRKRLAKRAALIALFCSVLATGARAEVVSLATLEQNAISNRPALAREGARARAASADVEKAASAYYPQFVLRGTADVGPGRQLVRYPGDNGTSYYVAGAPDVKGGSQAYVPSTRTGLELNGSANLYDFGRTKAATEAARQSEAAARGGRDVTEAELREAVRESYLGWLLNHELKRRAEDALKEASARRERVSALIGEGVKPKGELTPARADELLTRLELQRAERDLEQARLVLSHQSGILLTPAHEPDVALLQVEASLPDQSSFEANRRRALMQRLKAAQAMADAQKTLNRPQLGVGLSAGVRTSTQQVIPPPDTDEKIEKKFKVFPLYGAGLTLNIPLWDGGHTRASAEGALARAEEARANLAEFEQERAFAQSQAELDRDSALTRLETAEELVTVCAARLKDAEDGYELGATSIDLIAQARSLLRRAETEALLARVDHASARLRMVRADAPSKPSTSAPAIPNP
jgi:outer membrane protein TolC